MASKGMKNLFGGLFGGKPKQDERSKNTPPNVTAPRAREKEMIALLDKLELDHPQNKLSREKMEELNIQGVINYARSELHFPFITEFDTKNLDANIFIFLSNLYQLKIWAATFCLFSADHRRAEACRGGRL